MKRKRKTPVKGKNLPEKEKRGFDSARTGRIGGNWLLSGLSVDAEIRQSLPLLRERCRDLERNNDYMRGAMEDVEANTLGSEGVIFQSKIKEEADRIIHDPDEKAFIEEYQTRVNKRREFLRKKLIQRGANETLVREVFPDIKLLHRNGNRAAKVLKGQDDVYANMLVEKAWKKFGSKQQFTVTRELTRKEGERLWLRSTFRDGANLVRKVKGFDNDFKFALQFIDIDWLDISYNVVLPNGHEVRMGKEYNQWKECVAYHILVKNPGDWMWGTVGFGSSFSSGRGSGRFSRMRIDASEIIHGYIRERIDQSREIPWPVSCITKMQMLGKFEEAELVATLLSARKTGTWYSEMLSEPGTLTKNFTQVDRDDFEEATEPGQDTVAPYGWKYEVNDPTHPNTNLEQFKRVMLQGIAAGLPGASYHRISQDPSGLSFSNLRGIELQSREAWMMIQSFMRDNLHDEIFPDFLESGLMSGQIPLPISKFDKFNQPTWTFRRWKGIDPIKEAEANKANLLLGNTTRTKIAAESGADFEENLERLILEEDMLEVGGLTALKLESLAGQQPSDGNSTSDGSEPGDPNDPNTMTPSEELKAEMDAYGVGVRAGAITPQEDDEAAFRERAKLPKLSSAGKEQWKKDKGVRRPITLAPPEGTLNAPVEGKPPAEPEE